MTGTRARSGIWHPDSIAGDQTTRTRTRVPPSEEVTRTGESMPTASKDSRASIDRFEIVRKLGSGAMGSVFEAHDPKLDRRVALKLLHADTDPEHRDSKRLLREARALARISHPNVVEIYDVGTDGDRVWLAMELVEGRTLKGWALANHPAAKPNATQRWNSCAKRRRDCPPPMRYR